MKKSYVNHSKDINLSHDDKEMNDPRVIFYDDFPENDLENWNVVDKSSSVETINGKNVLTLNGLDGIGAQLDKITNSYCYLNLTLSIMLEGQRGQLNVTTSDNVFYICQLKKNSNEIIDLDALISGLKLG